MEKEKTKLYQKWWFWVVLLIIVLIIAVSIVLVVSIKQATENGLSGIAYQIQQVYDDATLYGSAGENTLILELKHYNSEEQKTLKGIFDIIKENYDTELNSYSKLIVFTFLDSDEQNNNLLLVRTVSLPDLKTLDELEYIDYSIYENTMNNYTNLFNSIGR